ncbi:MAG: hypothetical protein ACK53L_24325, partial [Pirellulaceae bacterium]
MLSEEKIAWRQAGTRWLRWLGPLWALLIVVAGFAIADQVYGQGRFAELRNLRVILAQTAPV